MKKTNPIFTLKNFRSFGEEGADFELAPITVLTGCNSAGKSSLVKALMLLDEKTATYGKINVELKVSSKKYGLGGFTSVAHNNGKITISYRMFSVFLLEEVVVRRTYVHRHGDLMNDGRLSTLTIEKTDGTLIYQIGPEWNEGGFPDESKENNSIVDNYKKFYVICRYYEARQAHVRALRIKRLREEKGQLEKELDFAYSKKEIAFQKLKGQIESFGLTDEDCDGLWKEYEKVWQATRTAERTYRSLKVKEIKYREDAESRKRLKSDGVSKSKDKNDTVMVPFFDALVESVVQPYFTKDLLYVDSASAIVARLYSSEDDNKICNALRRFNDNSIGYQDMSPLFGSHCSVHKPGAFVNKWIKKFNLGDSIQVKGTNEGLGLMLYLINGDKKRLLSDEGYGVTQLVSLLLQIDNKIPVFLEADLNQFVENDIDVFQYPIQTICVEEPEVHLHPKYQSMLAEMFVEAYQKYNIHFIIETHSEYLIRKLQVLVASKENALTANDVSLNYVEKGESGVSTNRKIGITEDGRLMDSFGEGFFDEAGGLSRQLLKLNM